MGTPRGERQLIVLVRSPAAAAGSPAAPGELNLLAGAAQPAISSTLKEFNATIKPLFAAAVPPTRRRAGKAAAPAAPAPPSVYNRVLAGPDQLDNLAEALRKLPTVEAAYVKPAPEPAVNTMTPKAAAPAAASPDFSSRQDYLAAAPGGIDARYAWTQPGGRGEGVTIIDVEGEWRTTHEDLGVNNNGVLGGVPPGDLGWRNHGSAVVGTCNGANNGFGVTGICTDARIGMISIFPDDDRTTSAAIREAADKLGAGDILLIELHYPGPKYSYAQRADQAGYIAIEWWPDEFDAISYAVNRGVIVVEAGGNGGENLDDALYDTRDPGFPVSWTNPFRRKNRDSGAILVGAGAPPPGTHGRNLYGPDRSRLDFSNYGSSIDAQGWGREVTTCGYGDLQGGLDEDRWYTDQFAGTSSASPIVVGALACLQGIMRARGGKLLTPATARALLLAHGSPQQASPTSPVTQRIGNRPDLKAMVAALAAIA